MVRGHLVPNNPEGDVNGPTTAEAQVSSTKSVNEYPYLRVSWHGPQPKLGTALVGFPSYG